MATVMPATDVETIKRRLYRTDLSAKGQILPEYQAQLSEADLAQYRDQGYLAMEGLFTAEEVESFKAGVADVIHGVTEKDKKLYIQEEPYFKEDGADERVGVNQAVVIPLKPGGALFFSGLIHHGTPPNVSGDRRRALQFHYAAENCRNMTFSEHAELFNEGGAYAGCRKIDPASGLSQAVRLA